MGRKSKPRAWPGYFPKYRRIISLRASFVPEIVYLFLFSCSVLGPLPDICIYTDIYTYVHVQTYVYTCVYTHVFTNVYIYICIHIYIYVCVCDVPTVWLLLYLCSRYDINTAMNIPKKALIILKFSFGNRCPSFACGEEGLGRHVIFMTHLLS